MKLWRPVMSAFALASAVCLLATISHAQTIQVSKDNRTIAITATGSASIMADAAAVHVGYQAYGPDSAAAYAKASKLSNAIIKALTEAGAAKDAIESDTESIAETQPYELEKLTPAEQAQRKFRVQQSWTVKTDVKNASRILNAAVNAGANHGGQIDWTVADENALEAQAAGHALTRARTIAAQMAKGLGIKLGDLIYASNQSPEPRPVMMRAMAKPPEDSGNSAPASLAIQPHKVERSATIYAVFAIE